MVIEAGLSQKAIQDNFIKLKTRIERVAQESNRDPESIKLVVVTKKQPIESIKAVIDVGAVNFGENYVDEALPKIDALVSYLQIKWHMIGHVQSRKARDVCKLFRYIHSLDSLKLAIRMDRFAEELGISLPVLLQFNLSGEETKSGWTASNKSLWSLFLPDIENILTLKHLEVQGVMTMPPYTSEPEDARSYFKRLVHLRDYLVDRFPWNSWVELSMGMSADYEIAIQEGATFVRVGQAIFGARP